ncbi:hypothetical protein [Zunongwangia sp.]|uniref:hypothetical protein n=1 Tax=Zunongwangia sp. TaxID=1965325 RepID=UPI003AA901AE
MNSYCFIICLCISSFLTAQVGINTDNPKATLHIESLEKDAPSNTDGILIPRINNFPETEPSQDQHAMLVFLNRELPNYKEGFYYWNDKTNLWTPIEGDFSESNFYKTNTNSSPNNINETIYRNGSISIGTEETEINTKLHINTNTDTIQSAIKIENNNPSTAVITSYGIEIDNNSLVEGKKYGIKNKVSTSGEGIHYGIFNETFQSSGTNIYGLFNRVGRTAGASSNNYGIYSEIGSGTAQGNIYGIYSTAEGNSNADVFAGYFAGRLGIGRTTENAYIFPEFKGQENQVLALTENGILEWRLPSTQSYISTTSSTGDFLIEDEVGTLRINDNVDSVVLPIASEHKGRTITLIIWSTTSEKIIKFQDTSDDLFDVRTSSSISSLESSSIYTIQSAGNRWILLNKF